MKKLALVVIIGLTSMYSLAHAVGGFEKEAKISIACDKISEHAGYYYEFKLQKVPMAKVAKDLNMTAQDLLFYPILKKIYTDRAIFSRGDAMLTGWAMCKDYFNDKT